jgi:hypothetical protein
MKKNDLLKLISITGLILLGAISRFIPHPPNFTPISAMALFGGAKYNEKHFAFIIPLLVMFFSDLIIGFHTEVFAVYLCFIITVALGIRIRNNPKIYKIALAIILSSVIFFLLTNLSYWLFSGMYPHNLEGLIICYWNALPFFRNELFSAILYNLIFFGGYALASKLIPELKSVTYSV